MNPCIKKRRSTNQLNIEGFQAPAGWLEKWKKRYNVFYTYLVKYLYVSLQ